MKERDVSVCMETEGMKSLVKHSIKAVQCFKGVYNKYVIKQFWVERAMRLNLNLLI